jgi:hypothetical protein
LPEGRERLASGLIWRRHADDHTSQKGIDARYFCGDIMAPQMRNIQVRRFSSFEEEQKADTEYWAAIPPDDRVAMVEQLRRDWAIFSGQTEERLRRVVRVLDRKKR